MRSQIVDLRPLCQFANSGVSGALFGSELPCGSPTIRYISVTRSDLDPLESSDLSFGFALSHATVFRTCKTQTCAPFATLPTPVFPGRF